MQFRRVGAEALGTFVLVFGGRRVGRHRWRGDRGAGRRAGLRSVAAGCGGPRGNRKARSGGYDFSREGFGANGYGRHSPDGYPAGPVFLVEMILTAILVFTVLAATDKLASVAFAGIPIGLVLTLIHLVHRGATHHHLRGGLARAQPLGGRSGPGRDRRASARSPVQGSDSKPRRLRTLMNVDRALALHTIAVTGDQPRQRLGERVRRTVAREAAKPLAFAARRAVAPEELHPRARMALTRRTSSGPHRRCNGSTGDTTSS